MSKQTTVKRDKCLVCKTITQDRFWIYLWKGKQGYTCEDCGHEIHKAGYTILEKIETILKDHGVTDVYSKEKFGYYRLDATVDTTQQLRLSEALFNQARLDFPEFSFDFHAWLKHTNSYVR
jgi:ribosomal protein L37AE/L43A